MLFGSSELWPADICCFVVVINAFTFIFMMSEFLGFDLALVNEQLPFYYSVVWLGIAL